MKRIIVWTGLLLLLFACSSLRDDSQLPVAQENVGDQATHIEFVEVRFRDFESSWMNSDDGRDEEQGVRLRLEGIYALDGNIVFVYGQVVGGAFGRSVLLRSSDSGRTWREVMTPASGNSVLHIAFVEGGYGWALAGWTVESVGLLSLYHSADYGRTWERLSTISNDRGVPYGTTFFDKQNGQIKISYFTANPYTDRLAILITIDGGLTWEETSSFPMWREWDRIGRPEFAFNITNKTETKELFTNLSGWDNTEDGFGCWEQCATVGQDGSHWQLYSGGFQENHVVSYRLPGETEWIAASIIPSHYNYSEGRITPPE